MHRINHLNNTQQYQVDKTMCTYKQKLGISTKSDTTLMGEELARDCLHLSKTQDHVFYIYYNKNPTVLKTAPEYISKHP